MPSCLYEYALARIDQNDGEVSVRGPSGHISRILFVTRRIRDNERAPRCGEKAVGDVDSDALFALHLKPVQQKSEVDLFAGRAMPTGIRRERRKLIIENEFRVVQQSADQSRF